MIVDLYSKETGDLYETPIVQQTAFWSVVKKKLGFKSLALNFKSRLSDLFENDSGTANIIADILIIIQNVDKENTIAYVPYGPELEPDEENQGPFLEELSECMRSFLPGSCFLIRYDLNWESYWAKSEDYYDERGWWIGPPGAQVQELRFNFNTQKWNFRKAGSNILPSNTLYLNLQKQPSLLLKEMKPKTRYNIGLSQRRGVEVKSESIRSLDIWYDLYRETALRNGIYLHDIDYFKALLTAEAYDSRSPAAVTLLIAESGDKPLAAMFLVISGNRASYLYGASPTENRKLMATYALQWRSITLAKEMGCTEYDMFGIAPRPDPAHPLYGLYRFKTGFGGRQYHSMGCWDYPLDMEKYNYFTMSELVSQGYHIN
jgi:lipid II:glycine glycyltransferase (peptidoglycan interpeptide bridge formation enzyme)